MIALYTDRASQEVNDAVNLCTIHSAKGLEFDGVIMAEINKNQEDDKEENLVKYNL